MSTTTTGTSTRPRALWIVAAVLAFLLLVAGCIFMAVRQATSTSPLTSGCDMEQVRQDFGPDYECFRQSSPTPLTDDELGFVANRAIERQATDVGLVDSSNLNVVYPKTFSHEQRVALWNAVKAAFLEVRQ